MKFLAGILKLLYGLLWLFTGVSAFVAVFLLFDAGWSEFVEGIGITVVSALVTWPVHGLADLADDLSRSKASARESWRGWSRGKKLLLNLVGLWLTLTFAVSLCVSAFAAAQPQYALLIAALAFLFFLLAMRKQEKLIHGAFGSGLRIFFRALGNTCASFFLGAVISMAAPLLGLTDRIINPGGDLPACCVCCILLFLISNFRKERTLHFSHRTSQKTAAKKPVPTPSSSQRIKSNPTQTDLLVAKLQANPTPAPVKPASTPLPNGIPNPVKTSAAVPEAASPAARASAQAKSSPVAAKPTAAAAAPKASPTPAKPVTPPPAKQVTPVSIPTPPQAKPVPAKSAPRKGPGAAEIASMKRKAHDHICALVARYFPDHTVMENIPFDSIISDWWICGCGAENEGGFCGECGRSKSEGSVWTCKCGLQNSAKFCTRCGRSKPKDAQKEPIHLLLMENGIPKLAILIVTRRRWDHKPIRNTIEACETAGIPWQRYFAEYDNLEDYVLERIRGALH